MAKPKDTRPPLEMGIYQTDPQIVLTFVHPDPQPFIQRLTAIPGVHKAYTNPYVGWAIYEPRRAADGVWYYVRVFTAKRRAEAVTEAAERYPGITVRVT